MVLLGAQRLLELRSPRLEAGWPSAAKRRKGTSSGVSSSAPIEAGSSRSSRWKISIARARAAPSGQRSTLCHRPATSGHTAS
jgi:hypothetical protein